MKRLDDEIRDALIGAGKQPDKGPPSSPLDARDLQDRMSQVFSAGGRPGIMSRDLSIDGPAGAIAARLFLPNRRAPRLLLFIHGGGWVGGSLDTHDRICRQIVEGAGCAVLATTYRLAPEHRFPAQIEDCVAAARWCLDNAGALRCDADRLGIAGESAGANLATVTLLSLGHEERKGFGFQLLAYPATDLRGPVADGEHDYDPVGLTIEEALWCKGQYLADASDADDWRASPILAPHIGELPKTIILTAEIDPLRANGIEYADALLRAGVAVKARDHPGLPHGFLSLPIAIPRIAAAFAELCGDIDQAFEGSAG